LFVCVSGYRHVHPTAIFIIRLQRYSLRRS
jgi:hypothetical protein